jgi:hypothetical protein
MLTFDMRKGEEATTLVFGGDDSTDCDCIVQGYVQVFVFIDPKRKPVPPMQITANVRRDQHDFHRFVRWLVCPKGSGLSRFVVKIVFPLISSRPEFSASKVMVPSRAEASPNAIHYWDIYPELERE